MVIDWAAMQMGDVIVLPGTTWNDELSGLYDQAQAYVLLVNGAVQFEFAAGWQIINGKKVRQFTVYRTR